MRERAPFQREDLDELDSELLAKAANIVAIEDVHDGVRAPNVIGLRHDCDAGRSLSIAVKMARWEYERGYRSTYYILHTAPYWNYPEFREMLERIAGLGHEIGIHADALALAVRTGMDPDVILDRAIQRLRSFGHRIRGVAGHGNSICLRDKQEHESPFANDEQFAECRRPKFGEADRVIARGSRSIRLQPRPLADFGLEYEALWTSIRWPWRCADSGGKWIDPGFGGTVARFAAQTDVTALPEATEDPRQLHLLVHPDWWGQAFHPARVTA